MNGCYKQASELFERLRQVRSGEEKLKHSGRPHSAADVAPLLNEAQAVAAEMQRLAHTYATVTETAPFDYCTDLLDETLHEANQLMASSHPSLEPDVQHVFDSLHGLHKRLLDMVGTRHSVVDVKHVQGMLDKVSRGGRTAAAMS